ncbi:Uncharacterised protein [[Eubacterium] contortum]|uniref:Flp pilus assembly protein TadB n=1 Tax=Faecalicatena contorta TaxID=39482 RepID=A0A174E5E5_9FIRM|nr:hypothetical protein [Faecalicatena contorta]MBS6763718.1 hypothetical protein [Clostridium sp.]CUO32667.1 Uncharacterised protein [[Eubacterium] contortum] [Faecalicatena contorta]
MKKKERGEGICYLNPGYLKRTVRRFGYQFSARRYVGYFLGLYGCVAVLAFAFRLKLPSFIIIAAASACFVPGIFAMTYRNLYEARLFEDVTSYIEQMLYSFKRRSKILTALEDTLVLFEEGESRMYDAVHSAIRYIQNESAGENLYREAFAMIEKEYGCRRLYKVHDFLIEAEAVGGDFTAAADILLNDRKLWMDRVYELQREKKNVKVKITIGIGLSFLICGMTVLMLPKEFGITENVVSQTVTTVTVLLNMLIWYIAQRKLSKSLIRGEEGQGEETVKRQYEYVMHSNRKKAKRKAWCIAILLIPVSVLMALYVGLPAAVLSVIMAALMAGQPDRRYRISLKHVAREVEKSFPEWLMSMSLHLQTDNVHVSLSKSIPHAPAILREELNILLAGIEEKPDSVRPYLSFMKQVPLPDVTSAMKVLYSMAEFGASDIGGQIGPLAERGAVMTDKAERLRTEDYIAGISFLILLPMITGVLKMLADLALVVVYILSAVNHAG